MLRELGSSFLMLEIDLMVHAGKLGKISGL